MGVTAHTSVDGAKLLVPERRRELVIRHRINALLDAADEHRVILIQAPAGYGKTSALIDWLAARSKRVAWVSLDRWDNDVQRLAAHVVAACECTLPGTFADLQHALSGGSDLMQTCLPLLGNTLREHVDERLILVLDDYHVITDSRCHEFIRGCLDVMPLQVQTVLSSRTQPPLRLARRLAAGTLARIGSEQLRFTPSESEQLLNGSCELRLDPSELAEVDDRLKGWPAAVSLLALSLRIGGSQAGTAGERDLSSELAALTRGELADYVIEEILDHLPPAHHEFILRTAILERLNGPLCTAVLDDPGAPELLEDIRLSGQFVDAVDSAGGWLRVHDLIRSPLAVVLAQREPAIVPVS